MKNRSELAFSYFFRTWIRQSWDLIGAMLPIHSLFFLMVVAAFAPAGAILSHTEDREISFNPWGPFFFAALAFGFWGACWGWLAFHRSMRDHLMGEDPAWNEFLFHLRPTFRRSGIFFLFLVLVSGVLIFNLFVYPSLFANHPAAKTLAMAMTLWMLVFLGMVQVHLGAFLAVQGAPFPVALKRAATVALWAPFRTLGLLAVEVLAAVLFFPPLCFILPGMAATANTLHLTILLEEWKDPYEKTSEESRFAS